MNRLAVSEKVKPGIRRQKVLQTPAHFVPQKAEDRADLLQRDAFAPQFRNHGNLKGFVQPVTAPIAFVPRTDHLALVPPLQLAESELREPGDVRRVIQTIAGSPQEFAKINESLGFKGCSSLCPVTVQRTASQSNVDVATWAPLLTKQSAGPS